MAEMFIMSLGSLELKPEQKTAVDGIEGDLEKLSDASKEPRAKLGADVADGVAAGKLDHKKTDADIAALVTAVTATVPSIQDAMNHLYKVLDADQRKKLVETMHAKGKEMHEHVGMPERDGKEHEHEGKGPEGHKHEGKEHEHEHQGKEHEHMGEGPLMKLSEELALTPEQKEKLHTKLEGLMKANHAAMKTKMEAGEKHMEAVGAAFAGDKFDAKQAGVGTHAPEMTKVMATQRVQFVETVLGVLTPEQRVKFAAHVKEHAADAD